ncbi:hypothetical protein [Lactobacillus sp. PSON]|uniref:hypothetical protein n=1 Tax=Lactobacillus sp. PSON TaxID=3455454 RepID=UPI004043702C
MKKSFILLTSAVLLGISATSVSTQTVNATSNRVVDEAKIQKLKIKYDTKSKELNFSGLATKGEKVIINYNGKKVKIAKVNNGHFTANVKFVGYKPFTIYAVNSKGKRVTPISKVTSNNYAAKTPVAIKSGRTKKGISYTFNTIPNNNLVMYFQGNKVLTKKTSSKTTKVFIPAKELKNKKGHFTVKQLQKGKKASPASKAEIVKVGVASVLNY